MNDDLMLDILRSRVFTALGCTDPVVVSYAAALAASVAEGNPEAVTVTVDKSTYKNALRVTIPKTDLRGLDYACALGLIGGKAEHRLECLKKITSEQIDEAIRMVKRSIIKVRVKEETGLYSEVALKTGGGSVTGRIEKTYTNITALEVDGENRLQKFNGPQARQALPGLEGLTLAAIYDFVESCRLEKLLFLEQGCVMNLQAARQGLKADGSVFFGQGIMKALGESEPFSSPVAAAKVLTAAASDMRMGGYDVPITATAGSGNQGITCLVPIAAVAEREGAGREELVRAAALGHLVAIYIKDRLNDASQACGCSIAAGAGAAAGVAYLLGGGQKEAYDAVINTVGGLAGVICDGAKRGCAYKLSISAGIAVESALLALKGVVIPAGDGIVSGDPEKTVANLSLVIGEGMAGVDDCVIKVLHELSGAEKLKK